MPATTSTTLAFPKPYLQCLTQTNSAAVQHLATLLQRPLLEQAWAYTTTDALRDTEQLLVMSTCTHIQDKTSETLMHQMSHGPDYPRHYARWMVLWHAQQSLVQLASEHVDAAKACADKLIAMVPQAELEAPTVSLRHTFAPADAPWLEGRTFVLTGELSEMDREAATALLQSQGAHVRTSVTRFTDFVVAGSLLRDGRLVTEGNKYKRMVELNTRRPNTQQWAQLVMEPQLRAMVPKKAWAKARKETAARRREAAEAAAMAEAEAAYEGATALVDLSTSNASRHNGVKTSTNKRKRKHTSTITTPATTDPPRRITRSMAKRRRHDA